MKVRIYKAGGSTGKFISKLNKFTGLPKARYGMQMKMNEYDIEETIMNELGANKDNSDIIDTLQNEYDLDPLEALDKIEEVRSFIMDQTLDTGENIINQETEDQEVEPVKREPLYNINEPWVSENDPYADYEEEDEDTEAEDTEEEEEEVTAEDEELDKEKKGGTVNKRKFVKNIVKGLRKASEGLEQNQSNQSSTLDSPIDGRQAFVNAFRRGVKDLGNEGIAKKLFTTMNNLKQQSGIPMGQDGMQVQTGDPEADEHHLKAYSDAVSNIFKQPMNQIHGAGFENIPEARRGREMKRAQKDFQNMFGDVAAGYFGVPGMPNYLQVISPNIIQNPQASGQGTGQTTQGQTGPLIDLTYKKGPWWTGKREWTAKGVPMSMFGSPSYGYMPGSYPGGYSSSWSTSRSYPGEIIRTKSRVINNAADPAKNNNVTLNNNSNTTKSYPGYMELNPAPAGTEMVYDAQGNEVEAISPDEAARRKAETSQYPWMKGSVINPGEFNATADPNAGVIREFPEEQVDYLTGLWTPQGTPADATDPNAIDPNAAAPDNTDPNLYDSEFKSRFPDPDEEVLYELIKNNPAMMDAPGIEEEYLKLGYSLDSWNKAKQRFISGKEFGGPVANPQMDPYGNLQKFVYGGNEMPISPIVAYDNAYADDSKNVMDPYFRNGGLYRFAGPNDSQVNTANTNPGATTWKDLTEDEYKKRLEIEKKTWEADWLKKQNEINNQNKTTTQTQNTTQGGGSYAYPTAPSVGQQLLDMFNPIKKDFRWARQIDFPRDAKGNIVKVPGGYIPGQSGQPQPGQPGQGSTASGPAPGYMPSEWKYEKGPWWSGKKTLTVKNSWFDPNNPNATVTTQPNANATTTTNTANTNTANTNTNTSNWHAPMVLPGDENKGATNTATTASDASATSSTAPEQPRKTQAERYGFDQETWENMSWRDQTDAMNAIEDQTPAPTRPITVGAGNNALQGTTGNKGAVNANPATGTSNSETNLQPSQFWQNQQSFSNTADLSNANPSQNKMTFAEAENLLAGIPGMPGYRSPQAIAKENTNLIEQGQIAPRPGASPDAAMNQNVGNEFNQATGNNSIYPNQTDLKRFTEGLYENPGSLPARGIQEIPTQQPETARNFQEYSDPWEGAATNDDMNLMGTMDGMSEGSYRDKQVADKKAYDIQQAKIAEQQRMAEAQRQQQLQQQRNSNGFGMSGAGVQEIAGRVQNTKDLGNRELVAAGNVYKMWENEPNKKQYGSFDNWAKQKGYSNLVQKEGGYVPAYMAYGGYMPSFDPGGQFSGSGPFDPNAGGVTNIGAGPCTEEQVLNARPGDICYNENYTKQVQGTPQDFTTKYEIETARTLRPKAIGNLKQLGSGLLIGGGNRRKNQYAQNWMGDLTTSDNRVNPTQTDVGGGYEEQGKEGSKGAGEGSTAFIGNVGESAFFRRGGQSQYRKGGVYDLTQEEIGKILAAGGQIKFI